MDDGSALSPTPMSSHEVTVTVMTDQLERILSTNVAVGETLKVEAAAGAGKSTALRLYAACRMHHPTLYLTFTKAEADAKQVEYTRRGLHHVTVSTLHALAFAATTDLHELHVVESLSLSAADVAVLTSTSSMDWPSARRKQLCLVLQCFFASGASAPCVTHVDTVTSMERLFGNTCGLLRAAQDIWSAACNGDKRVCMSHDMYLKICHVQPARRARMFGNAALVLLDEAQDCTEAQIGLCALGARTWGLVMVHDIHQRIYGWKHAAMQSYVHALPAFAIRSLSCSWRFGPELATLASALLSRHTGSSIMIQSSATHTTKIFDVVSVPFVKVCGVGNQLVVVARTLRSLFNSAMLALCTDAVEHISFKHSYSMFGDRDRLLDTYALYIGRAQHDMLLPDQGAALYANGGYACYRQAVYSSQWQVAIEACEAVEKFGSALPQLLRKLDRALQSNSSHSLMLVTVHEAKGGEWPHVYLHPDLARQTSHNSFDQRFRLNMIYVAVTRAAITLYVPSEIADTWFRSVGIVYV